MIVLGLAAKMLGPGLRFTAMVLAPVAAILAWGAVENGMDQQRTRTPEVGGAV